MSFTPDNKDFHPNRYFDNAATSFPKPDAVKSGVGEYYTHGGSYGRSASKRSFKAASRVERLRDLLAETIGVSQIDNLVFTSGATTALNMVLFGFSYRHKRVLHSVMEHNAVMRPLFELKQRQDVEHVPVKSLPDGTIDLDALSSYDLDNTDLIVINHQSNVNGVVQPLNKIRQYVRDLPVAVDASQSAGTTAIKADEWGLDFVVFTGHKSLLGPPGTGGLFIRSPDMIRPLIYGGTGSFSHSHAMPAAMPERFEAGTMNIAGLYGLLAALESKPESRHSRVEFNALVSEMGAIPGLSIHCADNFECQGSVISITSRRHSPSELADLLEAEYKIETRAGLHCAPSAHQHLNTFPAGTLRFSFSPFHSSRDLDYLLESMRKVMK